MNHNREIGLAKLGIKKLLDRSEPIQLLDFSVDVEADKRSVQASNEYWNDKDEYLPFKYVFRDRYTFGHQGTEFKLYINGQIQLINDGYTIEASDPEIKVIEVEKDGQESVTISDKQMDDELKNLVDQYSYSRNILIMEHNKQSSLVQHKTIGEFTENEFAEFKKETIDELLKFIAENKSDEFMIAYMEEKLDTAHLYGFNEGERK